MSLIGCKHSANAFCFACEQFIETRARKQSAQASITMCEAYKAYFGKSLQNFFPKISEAKVKAGILVGS